MTKTTRSIVSLICLFSPLIANVLVACSDGSNSSDVLGAGGDSAYGAGSTGSSPNGGVSGVGGAAATQGGNTSLGVGGQSTARASLPSIQVVHGRIAATMTGGCAIDPSGTLRCWGTPQNSTDSWQVPPGTYTWVRGFRHVYALRADRTAVAIPTDDINTDNTPPTGAMVQVDGGLRGVGALDLDGVVHWTSEAVELGPAVTERFLAISSGGGGLFGCGIRVQDNGISCWGSAGSSIECSLMVAEGQLAAPAGAFIDISSGYSHTCGVRKDGTIACWGAGEVTDDVSRQFCDQFANSGQSVPPIGTFVQVAAGSNHSCALRADGTIACWGAGKKVGGTCVTADLECGQSIPPVEGGFVEVAAGYSHSCALRADGKVKCWGSNTGGRATPPVELQY